MAVSLHSDDELMQLREKTLAKNWLIISVTLLAVSLIPSLVKQGCKIWTGTTSQTGSTVNRTYDQSSQD